MTILNVGYGTTDPQELLHLVQSNVTLILQDSRNNNDGTTNIEFIQGPGNFGENAFVDWQLSNSNSTFCIKRAADNITSNVVVVSEDGSVSVSNNLSVDGTFIRNGTDIYTYFEGRIDNVSSGSGNQLDSTSNILFLKSSNFYALNSNYIARIDGDLNNRIDATDADLISTSNILFLKSSNFYALNSNYVARIDGDLNNRIDATDADLISTSNILFLKSSNFYALNSNYIARIDGDLNNRIDATDADLISTSNILFLKSSNFYALNSNYIARIDGDLNNRIDATDADLISTSNILFLKSSNFYALNSNYIARIDGDLNNRIDATDADLISTSNILFLKSSNFYALNSNYIARIDGDLNNRIDATDADLISTSNILFLKSSNFYALNSNYIARIDGDLNNRIDATDADLISTSNILFLKSSNFYALNSNYVARIDSEVNARIDTTNANLATTDAEIITTSNILFLKSSNFDAHSSNYVARIDSEVNARIDTTNTNLATTDAEIIATSNILFLKSSNFDAHSSNYVARIDSEVNARIDTTNANLATTDAEIIATSNILFLKSSNFDAHSSNYVARIDSEVNARIDTTNTNLATTDAEIIATSNILFLKSSNFDAHSSNYVARIDSEVNARIDTTNTNLATTDAEIIATSNILFLKSSNFDAHSSNYVARIDSEVNARIDTTNTNLATTDAEIIATSNILFLKSSNFDAHSSNYVARIDSEVNARIDTTNTNLATTDAEIITTSNILFLKSSNFDAHSSNYVARIDSEVNARIDTTNTNLVTTNNKITNIETDIVITSNSLKSDITNLNDKIFTDSDIIKTSIIPIASTASVGTIGGIMVDNDTITIDEFGVISGSQNVDLSDYATKSYVDGIATGLVFKDSVAVATTANITLSSTQIIDGISVVIGDRILVKDQTTLSQNGIYLCASGSWTRTTDFNDGSEVKGAFVFVDNGDINGGSSFVCSNDSDTITIGTTDINFSKFTSSGQLNADKGLIQDGNKISINPKTNGGLIIDSNKQVVVDLSASLLNSVLPPSKGGTGKTTLNDSITLGQHTVGNYVATITAGNGLATTGTNIENAAHTLSIDAKTGGGLVIENSKLALDLGAGAITGTLAVSDGGTGATTLDNLITLGNHTVGNFVATVTAGDGLATTGTNIENASHTLSIDAKTGGGLVIENSKLALDLGANSITGTLAISDGGTGATTLDNLITLGNHTVGNFVATVTAGDGLATTGTNIENAAHTLSIDAKTGGGLVIENSKLALDLGAGAITGTLAVSDGGTGATTLDNLITLGNHTVGNFVATVTAGDGLATTGTNIENAAHTLSIDTKTGGGLVIENSKLALDLGAGAITGTLAVSDGGTGATTLDNLITLGNHTVGNFVATVTAGDGLATTGTNIENAAHTLSIDTKTGGGLVIENSKLALDLGANSITGTLAISDGGTGATTLDNLITLGNHTVGNFVATVTAGDGLATTGTNIENAAHTLSIDTKTGGGLVIENSKLALDLGANSITGTLAVSDGGTGATTLDNLITLGNHTVGNFVATVTAGDGLATTGSDIENAAHTLSIDAKTGGGLVIENNKLALDLGANSITGTLAVSDGGTGATTLDNLITLGNHTVGNFVATVTAGDGLATTGSDIENAAHTLSIDAKTGGGLVIENNKLALDLGASDITGVLDIANGGTGTDSFTTDTIPPGTSNKFIVNNTITGDIVVSGNILPSVTETFSLGSADYKWDSLYVAANTINIGNTKLSSSDDGGLAMNIIKFDERINEITSNELHSLSGISKNVQQQINELNLDIIADGTSNKFIVDDTYNGSMYIASNFYVGKYFSTENPNGNLHVYGDITIEGNINTIDPLITQYHRHISNYNIGYTDITNIDDTSNRPSIRIEHNVGYSNIMEVSCKGDDGVFTISSNGFIGINRTEPTEKLDVDGNVKISGSINNITYQELDKLSGIDYNIKQRIDNNDTNQSNYVVFASNVIFNKFSNLVLDTCNYISHLDNEINSRVDTIDILILSTSNELFLKSSNFDAHTSNYVSSINASISASINSINTIGDELEITSNILYNKSLNFDTNSSNYVTRINTELNTSIQSVVDNDLVITSNILFLKSSNFDAHTSNYVAKIDSEVNARIDTTNANLATTDAGIITTSNILFLKSSNFDAHSSNYVARIDSEVNARIDTTNANLATTDAGIITTSNILFLKSSNFDAHSSNYVARIDSEVNARIDTTNANLATTDAEIITTSNILFLKSSNFDAHSSNYVAKIDSEVNARIDTTNANLATTDAEIITTSNILFLKSSNFDAHTSNYVARIDSEVNARIDTTNANLATTDAGIITTSNILFLKSSNFDAHTSNYVARIDSEVNARIDTTNANLATTDANLVTTNAEIISTSNILFLKSSNFDAHTSNYVTRIDGEINTRIDNVDNVTNILSYFKVSQFELDNNDYINIRKASINNLGGVKVGNNTTIDSFGFLSVDMSTYTGDVEIVGDLTTSNLTILGDSTTLETNVFTTERLEINNIGSGTGISVVQSGGAADIFTASNGSGEVFSIINNGNVGIGVTNPTSNLDVAGDINFTGNLTQNGVAFSSFTSSDVVNVLSTSGGTGITWNSSTNKFDNDITQYTDTNVRSVLSNSAGSGLSWNATNNQFDNTITQYTDTNVRSVLSNSAGSGLSWNATNNQFDNTITQYTDADARSACFPLTIANTGLPGTTAINLFDNNLWYNSTDGYNRLYFYNAGGTYIRAPDLTNSYVYTQLGTTTLLRCGIDKTISYKNFHIGDGTATRPTLFLDGANSQSISSQIIFGDSGTYTGAGSYKQGMVIFFDSAANYLRISGDNNFDSVIDTPYFLNINRVTGDVGIGINTPIYKLDVNGFINAVSGYKVGGNNINFSHISGTLGIAAGGTGATTASDARTALGVDAAGTDNSTNVTLTNVAENYLTLSGQEITAGTVPISLGGTGATTLSDAKTALGITNVSLASVTSNYLSVSGNTITAGVVPLSLGGTGATDQSSAALAILPQNPTTDSFLKYDGTDWVATVVGIPDISGITDDNGKLDYEAIKVPTEITVIDTTISDEPNVISNNLVAWYKFDGDINDMLLDSSGNNHTLINPSGTTPEYDSSIKVDGDGSLKLTNDYVDMPLTLNPYTIWYGNGISFSLWFKMPTSNPNYARIFTFCDNNVGTNPANIVFICRQSTTSNLLFRIGVSGSNTDFIAVGSYVDDNWHHLVWNIDSSGVWSIYIDNLYINPSITRTPSNFTPTKRYIGRSGYPVDTTYSTLNLDDFRIYNKTLSATEISNLYNHHTLIIPYSLYTDTTQSLQSLAEFKTGVKGWRLVRFLPPTSSTWYSGNYFTTTNMEVSASLGTAYNYSNEFMVPFGTYDEIMFSTTNMQNWLYTRKSDILGNYSDASINVISSSINPNNHTVPQQYNRSGVNLDPIITLTGYGANPIIFLYLENSNGVGSDTSVSDNDGMCVFVRSSTATQTVNPTPEYKTLTFEYKPNDLIFTFRRDDSPYSWQEAYDEAIANGKRMPTKTELLNYLAVNGKYASGDLWCPVIAPEYSNGKDWIQIGDSPHFTGKSHTGDLGTYPSWGDNTTSTIARIYCEVSGNSLIHNFANEDTLDSWKAKANSIGATTILNEFQLGGVYEYPGDGYIEYTLPSGFNLVNVYFGNPYTTGDTILYIDDVEKIRCSAGQNKIYTQTYTSGQILKIKEVAGIIHPDLKIILISTQAEYTVNFPENTIVSINEGAETSYIGNYTLVVSSTSSYINDSNSQTIYNANVNEIVLKYSMGTTTNTTYTQKGYLSYNTSNGWYVKDENNISTSNLTTSNILTVDGTSNALKITNDTIFAGINIIPNENNAIDLGSVENKFRDVFISNNSLWIGDTHKLAISDNKMKFRKRNTTSVPATIITAGGTESGALTFTGHSSISDFKLKDWLNYMKSLPNAPAKPNISDIFTESDNDYDEESAADAWQINNTSLLLGNSYQRVGIGVTSPTSELDITGDIKFTGNIHGSGSELTALNATNIATGTIANARLPADISVTNLAGSGASITALNATNIATGTIANARLPADISVTNLAGSGASITALNATNIATGTIDNARLPADISVTNLAGSGASITALNATNIATGTIANARLPADISVTNLAGSGASITALNATNIATGTIANARLPADISVTNLAGSGTNITNLSAANLTGTINNARLPSDISITGTMSASNLNVTGTTTTISTASYTTENLEIVSVDADGPSLKITHDTVNYDIIQVIDKDSLNVLSLNHEGKLGIGVASPESKLHISNNSAASANVTLLTLTNGNGTGDLSSGWANDTSINIDFKFTDSNPNYTPQGRIKCLNGQSVDSGQDEEGSGNLCFFTSQGTGGSGSGTLSEVMRMTYNNLVGIGITNPVYKLDVSGDINCTGSFRVNNTALSAVAISGAYADISGTPDLSVYSTFSGSYNDLTSKPTLFSGSYNDLTSKPTLFSGSYNDLTSKPTLFSGSYNDLTDLPSSGGGEWTTSSTSTVTSDIHHSDSGSQTGTSYTGGSLVTITGGIGDGDDGTKMGMIVEHSNRTQAIGIGYNTISQVASASGHIKLKSKGTGLVYIGNNTATPLVVSQTSVYIDGNLGAGVSSPSARLHVYEATGTSHGANQGTIIIDHNNNGGASSIVFRSCVNRGSDYGYIQYQDTTSVGGSGESAKMIVGTSNDADDDVILAPSGRVGISNYSPADKFHVSGNILASGNITAYYSDMRLKNISEYVKNVLTTLDKISVFKYKCNDLAVSFGYDNSKNEIGLSAQEIKKYYPELIDLAPFDSIFDKKLGKKVSKSGDEYLTLNYERLVPILLQGIKELNANNKAIEEKNKVLEDKYNSLEKELQEIKKLLGK